MIITSQLTSETVLRVTPANSNSSSRLKTVTRKTYYLLSSKGLSQLSNVFGEIGWFYEENSTPHSQSKWIYKTICSNSKFKASTDFIQFIRKIVE